MQKRLPGLRLQLRRPLTWQLQCWWQQGRQQTLQQVLRLAPASFYLVCRQAGCPALHLLLCLQASAQRLAAWWVAVAAHVPLPSRPPQ